MWKEEGEECAVGVLQLPAGEVRACFVRGLGFVFKAVRGAVPELSVRSMALGGRREEEREEEEEGGGWEVVGGGAAAPDASSFFFSFSARVA